MYTEYDYRYSVLPEVFGMLLRKGAASARKTCAA